MVFQRMSLGKFPKWILGLLRAKLSLDEVTVFKAPSLKSET